MKPFMNPIVVVCLYYRLKCAQYNLAASFKQQYKEFSFNYSFVDAYECPSINVVNLTFLLLFYTSSVIVNIIHFWLSKSHTKKSQCVRSLNLECLPLRICEA